MTVTTALDLELLRAQVMTEGHLARGLPREMFTSPELFEIEQERLFHRTWACIGFAQDVALPGDVCPIEFAGLPLTLARGREGTLRVFHNVCPHRGMRIVRQAENRERLVCPYHCWTYDLQGQLLRRPYFKGPGDKAGQVTGDNDTPRLTEVRSARWLDAVFINVDGKAPAFEDHLRAFNAVAAPYGDLTAAQPCGQLDYDIRANWKLVAENNHRTLRRGLDGVTKRSLFCIARRV